MKQLLVLCLLSLTVTNVGVFTTSAFADSHALTDLKVSYDRSKQCRIIGQYEHDGQVVVPKASDIRQTQSLPMQVRARLDCQQRYTGKGDENQAVRFYNQAAAKIRVDKGDSETELGDKNVHIVTRITNRPGQRIQIASLADALRQRELDLLRNPIDPLTFPDMFTRDDVVAGKKWKTEDDALAAFLAVDRIVKNDVSLKLKSVVDDKAKIYITGRARAEVDDVLTDIDVSGIAVIDVKQEMVETIRMALREDRTQGQIAPGFSGSTKISMRLSPADSVEQLSTATIQSLTEGKSIERKLKWESMAGRFRLQYDPDWRMIASENEAAILRLLDDGRLLAQCNVVRMAARPADNPLTLDAFKTEVAKMISADKNVRLADARQMRTESGLTALEITVAGEEEGVPLTWIYHHVANKDGRRVTFVFTLEEEVSSRVTPQARKLVNSLAFMPNLNLKSPKKKSTSDQASKTDNSFR